MLKKFYLLIGLLYMFNVKAPAGVDTFDTDRMAAMEERVRIQHIKICCEFENQIRKLKEDAFTRLNEAIAKNDSELLDEHGRTPFLTACNSGDFTAVITAIQLDCNIFACDKNNKTGIEIALAREKSIKKFINSYSIDSDEAKRAVQDIDKVVKHLKRITHDKINVPKEYSCNENHKPKSNCSVM